MHKRLYTPSYKADSLSLLLNQPFMYPPKSPHLLSKWCIPGLFICHTLYELDYIFHEKLLAQKMQISPWATTLKLIFFYPVITQILTLFSHSLFFYLTFIQKGLYLTLPFSICTDPGNEIYITIKNWAIFFLRCLILLTNKSYFNLTSESIRPSRWAPIINMLTEKSTKILLKEFSLKHQKIHFERLKRRVYFPKVIASSAE